MIVHLIDGRVKGSPHAAVALKEERMFYVYVLRSGERLRVLHRFLDGLKRRLAEHTRGAAFATKARGPWKLVYYEAYTEREDAEGREKFLKSGTGRRLLRAQLRQYLRVKGVASRGSNLDVPTPH